MTTVKIISNPYDKKITYQRKNETSGEWIDIDYDKNPNSVLLKDEFTKGFFPFIADKIVDAVVEEYKDENGQVAIEFAGTEDEYDELALVCKDESHKDSVTLTKTDQYLENARDILPDIIDIFKNLNPLISETVQDRSKIQKELDKFSDAANDIIPICVLGNYSSGKSTFINALIGTEIMPSGDEPVTAKIYSVSRSKQSDRATVSFSYDGDEVSIRFDNTSYRFLNGESDKELISRIKKAMADAGDVSMSERVHIVLTEINSFENAHKDAGVSDLIKVTIPFNGGLWKQSDNEFVIFDTPGSNSASNDKHVQVLKKAMEDLSNGLPIFVSEYNTLDSTDNEKLNQEIKSMAELDSRFTMIIVNKADAASLPKDGFKEEDISRLLGEAIPRSLYSEGIFFVSSVIGLGSKTKGDFVDEHSSEVFDDQEPKYSDPDNKRYKQLYLYDIMPGKQKEHAVEAAQTCEDKLFANSGLYSVEREIQTFANKYSSYNKCQQSRMFLGKVIDITSDEIELAKRDREETKRQSEEKLEADKRTLIQQIESDGNTLVEASKAAYPGAMDNLLTKIREMYYQESLKDEWDELMGKQQKEWNTDTYKEESVDAAKATGDNLLNHVIGLVKTPSLSALKSMGSDFYNDAKNAVDQKRILSDLQNELDKTVSDQLIQMINDDFKNYCAKAQELLNEESTRYWSGVAFNIKNKLVETVTGSSALNDEKKSELSEIILSYQGIDFDNQEKEVFVKSDYEYGLKLFNVTIWKSDKVNLEKLRHSYNDEMQQDVNKIYGSISESHESSVKRWIQNLYGVIINNIVSYNPGLRAQQELIDRETERIIELENKQQKVYRYSEEIQRKMEWKEV